MIDSVSGAAKDDVVEETEDEEGGHRGEAAAHVRDEAQWGAVCVDEASQARGLGPGSRTSSAARARGGV